MIDAHKIFVSSLFNQTVDLLCLMLKIKIRAEAELLLPFEAELEALKNSETHRIHHPELKKRISNILRLKKSLHYLDNYKKNRFLTN